MGSTEASAVQDRVSRALGRISAFSRRAGAKAAKDVAAVGLVIISPGVSQQPRAGDPGAAAEDFAGAETGLRVFFVRVGLETGEGQEIICRPLPDVAEHLSAAARAFAFGQSIDLDGMHRQPIEIGAGGRRGPLAPGIVTFRACDADRVGAGRRGGQFPFGFRGQASPGPAAPGVGFVPVDVDDRPPGLERQPPVKVAAPPAAVVVAFPINGMFRAGLLPPRPTCFAPQRPALVAVV